MLLRMMMMMMMMLIALTVRGTTAVAVTALSLAPVLQQPLALAHTVGAAGATIDAGATSYRLPLTLFRLSDATGASTVAADAGPINAVGADAVDRVHVDTAPRPATHRPRRYVPTTLPVRVLVLIGASIAGPIDGAGTPADGARVRGAAATVEGPLRGAAELRRSAADGSLPLLLPPSPSVLSLLL